MANIPLQRGIGQNLSSALQILIQAIQRKQQMEQIQGARQAATTQVGVGATPVDFNRQPSFGVRQAPSMQENLTPYVNPDIKQTEQLNQGEFLRNLLMIASQNPMAKEQLALQSAYQPQYSFINQEGGGLQMATKPPFGGKPSVETISEPQIKPTQPRAYWTIKRDSSGQPITERFGSSIRIVEAQVDEFGRPTGNERFATGGSEPQPQGGAKSREQSERLTALSSNLDQYKKLLSQVKGGRIGGTISKGEALVEQNANARAAQGLENTLTGLIARVVAGEVGVLTDQDIERAKSMLPKITDNDEERALKFSLLKELIEERKKAFGGSTETKADPKDLRGLFD